jgi:hypothetical protein
MPNVEVKIGNFVGSARRYDHQPDPKREARLKIHAVSLGRVISDNEARAPDLGHYLVGNPAYIVLSIEAQRSKSRSVYSRIKTICPSFAQAWIE